MNFIKQNIEKMEDFSLTSTASTIPPEIISYDDDDDFLEEIDRVNDLIFGNVELHSTDCETNENNIDETKVMMMNNLQKIMTIQILVNFPLN